MKKTLLLGFSYIEVLISMVIISTMLLGIEGMHAYLLQQENNLWLVNVAVNQLQNIHERLMMVNQAASIGRQLSCWNRENRILLPNGIGKIEGEFPEFTISIFWGDIPQGYTCEKNFLGKSGCLRQSISL